MSERSLLDQVVDDLLSKRCTTDYVTSAETAGHAPELWSEFEALGLTLASVPESAGGSGGTLADDFTLLRAVGRYAAPLALMETGFLAGWLLSQAGLVAGSGPMTVAPMRIDDSLTLRRVGPSSVLTGCARGVPFASVAETVVALARDDADIWHVVVVPVKACSVATRRNLAAEWRDDLTFAAVELDPTAIARSPVVPDDLLLRGALGRAVMMLGALEATRDLAVDHAAQRQQFDRPVSEFQAVQTLLAQIARSTALARAAVEIAVEASDCASRLPLREVAGAKVMCGRAATTVARHAHQVIGAIGVTKEHGLHLRTRRLLAWREDFGSEAAWARRLGQELMRADGNLWERVTLTAPGGRNGPGGRRDA